MHEFLNMKNQNKTFDVDTAEALSSSVSSIAGFMEVITDGTVPAKMLPLYYKAVLTQTERLSHLTEQIKVVNKENSETAKRLQRSFLKKDK